jgi:hypothetical protein
MEKKSFIQSPLLTLEQLPHLESILQQYKLPQWVNIASLAAPEMPIDDNVIVLYAGDGKPDVYYIDPVSFVALCELTRFEGVSVATSANDKGSFYLKVTYTAAPEDNAPVSRLVADALPKEAVKVENRTDLRASTLRKISSGKATKGGRAIALKHAENAAKANAPEGFDVAKYRANIEALFAGHDRLTASP